MLHQIHPNKIRQILFLLIIVLLFCIISKELFFAFGALLTAITLYVLLRVPYFKMVYEYKWRKGWVAILCILVSFILIMLPISWLGSLAIKKIVPIVKDPSQLYGVFETIHQYVLQKLQLDIFNKQYIEKIITQVLPMVQKMIGGTFNVLGILFMAFLMLYFMLTQSSEMELWLKKHMPFKHKNSQSVLKDFNNLVYSNAIGIPIVAIVQGIVASIGYVLFGANEWLVMGALTAVTSVIPMIGTMIVYVPLALYKIAEGHMGQGIGILLWGLLVVGIVDNVARFILQKKMANIHPLITIFGVIIGVNIFGFMGIVFGPILLSLFTMLVKVYLDEFGIADADSRTKV